ncbi:MAG: CsgG/HfaB family protein [Rhodothermales bacterium]|nr:CsgG/HfaB family protein [Rhodothermales bacterium]
MRNFVTRLLVPATLVLLAWGCAPSVFVGELSDYERDIDALQRRLAVNAADAEALRDLGVIYLKARQYTEANAYLEQAYARQANDPKTLFHLGMANETLARRDTAIRLYEKYTEVSRESPYRRLMQGRYAWLSRRMLRDEMTQLASVEASIADSAASPRIVAVFPLVYQGSDARYQPLARGLAEMMSVDLARVNALRVVERIRLQALLDELELSQSQYMDAATAPRMGRMLGAGRLVSGAYNVLGGNDIRLESALVALETSELVQLDPQSEALRNLFLAQKAVVFDLIGRLGIELTAEERQQIEFIPTQNLQAFLAFSRGLLEEDGDNFGQAAASYGEASTLDPAFSQAVVKAEEAGAMADADLEIEGFIAESADADATGEASLDLMALRLTLLNAIIGNGFFPGDDSREPGPDAGGSGINLPDPPRPPGN